MIALDQIRRAVAEGIQPGVVLADAGYGGDMKFQAGLLDLGLDYAVGVQPQTSVWPEGKGQKPATAWSGRGRPPKRLQRSDDHQPVSAKELALSLPPSAWQDATWRAGSKGDLTSRFTTKRIRPAHRDDQRHEPWAELWLLVEWPADEAEPSKFWFANLAADISLDRFDASRLSLHLARLRWRIERDYLELKQGKRPLAFPGLGHYEGRGWHGFHHHASLCIAAYGFLIKELLASSPKGGSAKPRFRLPVRPKSFKPRGSSDQTRTSHTPCHRHHALEDRHRALQKLAPMSMLPAILRSSTAKLVTQ